MREAQSSAAAELAFELGKITRHAMGVRNDEAFRKELAELANRLMEAGHEKVAQDMLMVFVAGFQAEPQADRRSAQ